jgi:hypothetical protein
MAKLEGGKKEEGEEEGRLLMSVAESELLRPAFGRQREEEEDQETDDKHPWRDDGLLGPKEDSPDREHAETSRDREREGGASPKTPPER